jgi:hypothetical protein
MFEPVNIGFASWLVFLNRQAGGRPPVAASTRAVGNLG